MSGRDDAYQSICILALLVSLLASLSALFVGYRVGATNGHVLLVFAMNIMQLVYAVAVFIVNWMILDFDYDQFIVSETVSMFSGMMSTLLSNVLAYTAVHIIYYSSYVPVVENFSLIMLCCAFPGLIISIAYLAVSYPEESVDTDAQNTILLGVYYYLRIASIGFNFFVTGVTLYKIHLISSKQRSQKSLHEIALRALAKRMVLYPVVQLLGRSGFAWYEGEYGNTVLPLNLIPQPQYDAIVFCVLVTPMISVGYLIIFLFMQPEAMKHFQAMLCCRLYTPPPKRKLDLEEWKKRHQQEEEGNMHNVTGGAQPPQPRPGDEISNAGSTMLTATTLAAHTAGLAGDMVIERGESTDVNEEEDEIVMEAGSFDTQQQRFTEVSFTAQELAVVGWWDSRDGDRWNDDDLYRILADKGHGGTATEHTPQETIELSGNGTNNTTRNILHQSAAIGEVNSNHSYRSNATYNTTLTWLTNRSVK